MSAPLFHLAFPVTDLAKARAFYGGLLGCAEGRSSDDWVDFNFYGHQIVAHLAPGEAGHRNTSAVDGDNVPVRHFGVILPMVEWQALADKLTKAGIKFVIEPHVHPSVPVKTVKELIALAKARPGDLNYAAGGIGAPTHLAGELFNSMSKVKIVRINYKGSAPALNDLLAGHVQLMFAPGSVAPQIKAGRLRALGVTNTSPSVLFPGIPTIASSGVPGYEATSVWGLVAPAKTPAAVINRLNQEVALVLSKQDVKERLLNAGIEVVGNSPEAFASFIKSEIDRMGKVIKDAGIRDE